MKKELLINKITLLSASSYRCRSRVVLNHVKKEPSGFRTKLAEIYNKLSEEDLQTILELNNLL